jgi:hypothetical protein
MIPEAQYFDALPGEESVSFFVSCSLIGKTMSTTIQFDRELCNGAVEIEEVNTAGILATEFESVEAAVTEQAPQMFLCVSGFCAKLAREGAGGCSAGAMFAVV